MPTRNATQPSRRRARTHRARTHARNAHHQTHQTNHAGPAKTAVHDTGDGRADRRPHVRRWVLAVLLHLRGVIIVIIVTAARWCLGPKKKSSSLPMSTNRRCCAAPVSRVCVSSTASDICHRFGLLVCCAHRFIAYTSLIESRRSMSIELNERRAVKHARHPSTMQPAASLASKSSCQSPMPPMVPLAARVAERRVHKLEV